MLQIALTPEAVGMLHRILESYPSVLREEIAGTENMNIRNGLKSEEGFVKKLLQRLQGKSLTVAA